MEKTSEQLYECAKHAINQELAECVQENREPLMANIYQDGYQQGFLDGSTSEVAELSTELSRLREQTTWIDINDRLPEENEDVLAIVKYGDNEDWSEIWKVSWEETRKGITWYSASAYGHWRVVAWMPIHEIPEKYK